MSNYRQYQKFFKAHNLCDPEYLDDEINYVFNIFGDMTVVKTLILKLEIPFINQRELETNHP